MLKKRDSTTVIAFTSVLIVFASVAGALTNSLLIRVPLLILVVAACVVGTLTSSVRLAVVLLSLVVLASILGTLMPQTWTGQQYVAKYGEARYRVMTRLQLTDIYHSHWYTTLLAAFCVNLIVCSTHNLGPLVKSLKRSTSAVDRVELSGLPFHEKIHTRPEDVNTEEVVHKVTGVLTRSLYRLKYADQDIGLFYFERGKLGRLGPLITHASIVVILVGGILVSWLGFREYTNIPEGKTVDVPHSDFQLRLDEFKVEFYPHSGTPKEYTSVLTVIEDGNPKLTQAVEVNHPLKYRGVKFYQTSYGMSDSAEIELLKEMPDKPGGEVLGKFRLDVGQTLEVPDSQLKMKLVHLVPDFVRDGQGHVGTGSRDPNNPAALLELYEGEELENRAWAFLKHPEFHSSGESGYSLKFLSTGYYTGLQVSSDPAISVIWVGCLLMVAGMFLSFYLCFKMIWVRVSPDSVEIGGRSYRNRSNFTKEFDRVRALLG